MTFWSKGVLLGVAVWVVCIVFEFELLLIRHFEVRTGLRQLFGLPIYHVILTFLPLVTIVKVFAPRGELSRRIRWNWLWAAAHLVLYGLTAQYFESLWWRGQTQGLTVLVVFWLTLGIALLATWLAAWLPVTLWWRTLQDEWPWLRWVVPVSLAAPYLAESAANGWQTLASWTFELTRLGLSIFYDPVISLPQSLDLGTETFSIQVLPGCSGYEGMGLLALLVSAYLWVRRNHLRFPRALLLIPAGVILAYLANVLRLITLIVIGTEISPSIALRGFHSQAGWISFTVLAMALIALIENCPWFHRISPARHRSEETFSYPALPYLMPMAALLVATMVVQATTGRFAFSYPAKPVLAGVVLVHYFPLYRTILARPQAVAVLVGVGVWAMWLALVHPDPTAVSPYQALEYRWALGWIALRIVGGGLIVPLAEELAFRGYLMRRIQGEHFENFSGPTTLKALALSSLAFGFLHEEWLAGTCAGLAYGWVATRPGGLSNSVIAHTTTNLILAMQAVGLQQWGLW